jgi:hypothetical protein
MRFGAKGQIGWALLATSLLTGAAMAAGPTAITSCGTTITQPGSYVLTGNLVGSSKFVGCITVNTSFVTIDLQGFRINCNGAAIGIVASGTTSTKGLIVRNGFITNCSTDGINAPSNPKASHAGSLIENVVALGNGRIGVFVDQGSTVLNCIANSNGDAGFAISCPGNLIGNTATGNITQPVTLFGSGCNESDNLFK